MLCIAGLPWQVRTAALTACQKHVQRLSGTEDATEGGNANSMAVARQGSGLRDVEVLLPGGSPLIKQPCLRQDARIWMI